MSENVCVFVGVVLLEESAARAAFLVRCEIKAAGR